MGMEVADKAIWVHQIVNAIWLELESKLIVIPVYGITFFSYWEWIILLYSVIIVLNSEENQILKFQDQNTNFQKNSLATL